MSENLAKVYLNALPIFNSNIETSELNVIFLEM